ncbi:hypothetical protein SprV_0401453900 [Sparganum proliferum]
MKIRPSSSKLQHLNKPVPLHADNAVASVQHWTCTIPPHLTFLWNSCLEECVSAFQYELPPPLSGRSEPRVSLIWLLRKPTSLAGERREMNKGGGGDDGGVDGGRVKVFNGTNSGEGDEYDDADEVEVVNSSGDEEGWVDNSNGLNPFNNSRIGDCGPESCGEGVSANKASGSGVSGVEGFGDDGDGDGHAISAVNS